MGGYADIVHTCFDADDPGENLVSQADYRSVARNEAADVRQIHYQPNLLQVNALSAHVRTCHGTSTVSMVKCWLDTIRTRKRPVMSAMFFSLLRKVSLGT